VVESQTSDAEQELISVKNIRLDLQNPRFNDKLIDRGLTIWTDRDVQEVIEDDGLTDIIDSIKEHGVIDPIWVVQTGKDKYDVIEGSRRVIVLRGLLAEKVEPPKGIQFEKIKANVLPENISKKEIDKHRVVLQTGKKPWGPYNLASAIYNLVKNDHYGIDEVAIMMGKSISFIKKELENYHYYIEFNRFSKKKKVSEDPRKYTYFQRAGNDVREKFFGTKSQREKFYHEITPNKDGITRIPSVSLKGGLMNFNTISQNENILKQFLKNKKMSVEDALDIYKGQTLQSSIPWLKKLRDVAKGLSQLGPEDIKKIRNDPTILTMIKRVAVGTKAVLNTK